MALGRGRLYEPLSAVVALGRNPKIVLENADPEVDTLLGDFPLLLLVPFVISTGPI